MKNGGSFHSFLYVYQRVYHHSMRLSPQKNHRPRGAHGPAADGEFAADQHHGFHRSLVEKMLGFSPCGHQTWLGKTMEILYQWMES